MKVSFKKFIPGIAWFFIILYLLCLPGSNLPAVDSAYFDKVVHALLFAFLVLLFCWPFYKSSIHARHRLKYFIIIAIVASLWGLITEIIQHYLVAGRAFELLDWLADSTGVVMGFLFCRKKFI